MEYLNDFFTDLSGLLWGWPMIILLLGTHIFLTIRLRFPQRHLWTQGCRWQREPVWCISNGSGRHYRNG